jgi:hypothetical protein
LEALLTSLSTRWDIEMLLAESKQERGLDPYQLMSASALLRFWTLAMLAYVFLEEEQQRVRVSWQRPVRIGEARREIQRRHRRCLLAWLHLPFLSGVHPETLFHLFAASGGSTNMCKHRVVNLQGYAKDSKSKRRRSVRTWGTARCMAS